MTHDELFLRIDGTLLCTKCGTSIRVKSDEVFELHKAKCDEWEKMRQAL
jgi:hypothetical protein